MGRLRYRDVFTIDPLPVRGFDKVRSIVLLSVLLYQVIVLQSSSGKTIKGIEAYVGKLINQMHQVIFVIWDCTHAS